MTGLVLDSGDGVTHAVRQHSFLPQILYFLCEESHRLCPDYTVNSIPTHVLSSKVPVIDGFSFPNLTKRIDIAGRHVSTFMVELLQRRGYALNRTADLETVRQLKEHACFVALNYSQELKVTNIPADCWATPSHTAAAWKY